MSTTASNRTIMLSIPSLAILAISVVATTFLSGIFGIAGGLILLGICLALLDVAPAMILHGSIQMAANSWRAFLWREHLVWPIIWRYCVATLIVYIAMRFVAYIPDKATIYILLGIMPFATELLPKSMTPDIRRPGAPYLCGAIMAVLQVMAGAGGNIIDVFFQNSNLDRKQIVATKSATQAMGHILRVVYFGSFAEAFETHIPWWVFAVAIALAMLGTTLAGQALHRMSDADFRRYTRYIIQTMSVIFIARGLWLMTAG